MKFWINAISILLLRIAHTPQVRLDSVIRYVPVTPQDKSQGGLCGKSIYIDTEYKFRPERIVSIAQARGFNTSYTLSGILCVRAMNSHHQELILEKIVPLLQKDKKIRLLVVASIINNYRDVNFQMQGTLSERRRDYTIYVQIIKYRTNMRNCSGCDKPGRLLVSSRYSKANWRKYYGS